MQQSYTDEQADVLGELLLRQYFIVSGGIKESGGFSTTREVYKESFQNVFLEHEMEFVARRQ